MSIDLESVDNRPALQPAQVFGEPSRQASPVARATSLYRRVWRWHFWAGLIVAPVVLVAAVTGALYVFHDELEPYVYPFQVVVPQDERVAYEMQRTAARQAVPGGQLTFVSVPRERDRATMFWFDLPEHNHRMVYTDPYRGHVTGLIDPHWHFFFFILEIHRTLLGGTIGRVVVELAASWAIVLVCTGLFLWWPRGKRQGRGVFWPRLRGQTYAVLRDWHAVLGLYLSVPLVLILATGLFFTLGWGTAYQATMQATGSLPETFLNPPKSSSPTVGQAPLALDQAIEAARRVGFTDELSISLPLDSQASVGISEIRPTGASLSGMTWIDQYTGNVLGVDRGENLALLTTLYLYALPIHQGSIFGMPTKILALLATLVLMGSVVTGVWMWWRRRPVGRFGAPRRPQGVQLPRWLAIVVLLVALTLPTVAVSLVVVLTADWLWMRRQKTRPVASA